MIEPTLTIEDFFTYHPVQTEGQGKLHSAINEAALDLALSIAHIDAAGSGGVSTAIRSAAYFLSVLDGVEHLESKLLASQAIGEIIVAISEHGYSGMTSGDALLQRLMPRIQFTRMMLNQGATLDELLFLRSSSNG